MTIGIIFVGIALVSMFILILFLEDKNKSDFTIGFVFGLFISTLIGGLIIIEYNILKKPNPQAIDVYRNKTELEITSINGVPQDTVVVWKGGKQ